MLAQLENVIARIGALFSPGRRTTDRRRHPRHAGPALALTIEGRRYKTVDWSLGGMRLGGFHRPLARGERVSGRVGRIARTRAGEFVAEVVHVTEEGGV